jgi:hypothetical protein
VHCDVWPVCTEVGLQETVTEVMVGGVVVTVTIVLPTLVESWTDVASTVTVLAVPGAANNPEELIVPALALQVTAEL